MSFVSRSKTIALGDVVILYVNFNSLYPVTVTNDLVQQTPMGAIPAASLIGRPWGGKVATMSNNYVFALRPTPELWTKALPHRTQIIYSTDQAVVVNQLQLRPGSVIVEAGTGSGSLSHALARAVLPNGKLHTFDYHAERSKTATEEFTSHGLSSIVTAKHRDVCSDGFGDALHGVADAVFLDLPHPWEAIPHAEKTLKAGGRLCSFSPCVEQVQRACAAMRQLGFTEIITSECLLREFVVRKITQPVFQPDRRTDETSRKRPHEDDEEKDKTGETTFLTGVPLLTMPGHTGFLTFATLPTNPRRQKGSSD